MTDADALADELLRVRCEADPLWASVYGLPGPPGPGA